MRQRNYPSPCASMVRYKAANFSRESMHRLRLRRAHRGEANRDRNYERSGGIWRNLFGWSRRKIAKKIAKNKRCYANSLRPGITPWVILGGGTLRTGVCRIFVWSCQPVKLRHRLGYVSGLRHDKARSCTDRRRQRWGRQDNGRTDAA